MPRQNAVHHVSPLSLPEIRHLDMGRPGQWLRAGWHDLWSYPVISLGYGLAVALLFSFITLLLAASRWYHLALGLMAGFVFLGPVLAMGLYEMSRRLERKESVTVADALRGWRINRRSTMAMGVILMLLMMAWFMLSLQLTIFLVGSGAELFAVLGGGSQFSVFLASITLPMAIAFFATGLVFALLVFTFSAVSVPLLLDRDETDAITALVVSYKAVRRNWRPMLLWAFLIGAITGLSVLPLYLGLIVTFPLLGHATWHAYRDTLGEWQEVAVREPGYY